MRTQRRENIWIREQALRKEVPPRYKIVSMRLRDEEWKALRALCQQSKTNVSTFMREMLLTFATMSLDTAEKPE